MTVIGTYDPYLVALIATITFAILLALTASAFDRKLVQRSRELDEKSRQLRQVNDELLAIYEQGLFASHLNLEGRIVHANRACVEDLGFARADIIGKLFWEAGWWYTPEAQEWIRKAFKRAAAGVPFRRELSYVFNKDGAERVTDIAFIPIKDEAGRVTSVFVPGTDITDRARTADSGAAASRQLSDVAGGWPPATRVQKNARLKAAPIFPQSQRSPVSRSWRREQRVP